MATTVSDLIVVGGGPAGLAAAITAGAEGLSVTVLDAQTHIGGRPWESNAIENYPLPFGHPQGVTGAELMSGFVDQARKFGARFCAPCQVDGIAFDDGRIVLTTVNYEEHVGRSVVLSPGLGYRRLTGARLGPLLGRGVYYGEPPRLKGLKQIAVVGGANSAGQVVLKLARVARVHVLVRHTLSAGMSAYLRERIETHPNVVVHEGVEVTGATGDKQIETVLLSNGQELPVEALCVCIGATPHTRWLEGKVRLDDHKFVVTGPDADRPDRLLFETCTRGVFAAGDVRQGSVKRIASAIGEGVVATQYVRQHLARAA